METKPVIADQVECRTTRSAYPEPFASRMAGREKQTLGGLFGLSNFGVNRTTLKPGGLSSLRHAHTAQDEFVFVLSGEPTLVIDSAETVMTPGTCVGFKAGSGIAHHFVNWTDSDAVFLEVGDRTAGDVVTYPDDDLQAVLTDDGQWRFVHKDGSPYQVG